MRADRLIAILLELQARGRTSSRKLAGKLEVSERTIHRDMEALSVAGIPVYALRGPDGGWELAEGYRTNLTAMQRTEVLALIFATAVSPAGTPAFRKDFEAAITRLLAAMPPQYKRDAELARERIHVDGAAWCAERETGEDLMMPRLQEAVWSCERLEIEYRRDSGYRGDNGEGEAERPRRRTVRPLGLVAKRQTWYLVADTRDGMRSFRVSRIQSAKNTGKKFTRPKNFDLAEHWHRSVNEFRARLPEYRVRLRLRERTPGQSHINGLFHMPIQNPKPCTDRPGWIEAEANFETEEWARMFFAGVDEEVEVLGPAKLRARLAATGARLRDLYSS